MDNKITVNNVVNDSELMEHIANGTYNENMVTQLTEKDKTINQMKLFLLAQAKRELKRVLKLTEFLDKIEESYEAKVMDSLDELSIEGYTSVINTIMSCLQRSNSIVQGILKDSSLTNLVIIDNSVNKNATAIGPSNSLNLDSPDSRDRVNKIVQNMLNTIENYKPEDIDDGVVVDETI